jgi:hypothetical protein
MSSSRKSIERASELQGTSVAAWYLAVCFVVVMLGGIWVANTIGWVDFGSEAGPTFDKKVAAAAARKAANREAQARQAAQQEAQNLAEDSARAAVVPASPVATASPKVEAAPAEQASAATDSK